MLLMAFTDLTILWWRISRANSTAIHLLVIGEIGVIEAEGERQWQQEKGRGSMDAEQHWMPGLIEPTSLRRESVRVCFGMGRR